MLYLYGFVPHDARLPGATGIDGTELVLVPLGALAAVAGLTSTAVEPSDEHVLEHARVVEALASELDAVLPARFGRGFGDRSELEAAAARLAPGLERRLEDVRGCVEIGLHVAGPPQPVQELASGREYLQRRLDDLARLDSLAEDVHAPLAERARAATRARGVGGTALLRAAYLVPKTDVERFREAVDAAQSRYAELSFACTGPWPPYSFAEVEHEGAAA
jgi:hypothetical protein